MPVLRRTWISHLVMAAIAPAIALTAYTASARVHTNSTTCAPFSGPNGVDLPLPGSIPLDSIETLLYAFLNGGCYYDAPGWAVDKRVRDTGPYINQTYYGPHPAVRVFYSPDMIEWMRSGRQGRVPDGAIVIKEMYNPPAARYEGLNEAGVRDSLDMWTVMIRDSAGSKDGWFWSFYMRGQPVDSDNYPFAYPNSGFGQYCVRCHASAEAEHTFASLRNVKGEAGEPVQYRVDDSWRPVVVADPPIAAHAQMLVDNDVVLASKASDPAPTAAANFLRFYNRAMPARVVPLPPVTHDYVISGPNGPTQFLTSNQCMSCHDGQGLPFGPNMYIASADSAQQMNLSPYGEWNWSLMGLAGRDPVFFAQVESEQALQPTRAAAITNTCFSCHGVMGQRQLALDQPGARFSDSLIYITDRSNPRHRYGALARDGVSCTVCHQIIDDRKPLSEIITGRFSVSAPDSGVSRIYGPFDQPTQRPMLESLGMRPEQNDYIKSARLCGSCHTVQLPVYNAKGDSIGSFFEQTTYLEWLNSAYRNDPTPGATPRTCQSCHMTTHYEGKPLEYRIANVQDQTYPEADHLAPLGDITVNLRKDFARHTLSGANPFVLEMFNQFDSILGVRKKNFMTYSGNGLPSAIAYAVQFARDSTADVTLLDVQPNARSLDVRVRVVNRTGHRFPTGVGFRRAFLNVQVTDPNGKVLWASGRSNDLGVIVDSLGRPLPSEFFDVNPRTGQQSYQPHHQCIDSQDEVQIYQELVKDPAGRFTTSFVALADVVKDNRLLPHGWTASGPPGFEYAAETQPHGGAATDPDFGAGGDVIRYRIPITTSGNVTVTASLYYQTIPPSYLRQRFSTAKGRNGDRLAWLTSRLNVKNTAIDGWKLLAGQDSRSITVPGGVGEASTTGKVSIRVGNATACGVNQVQN